MSNRRGRSTLAGQRTPVLVLMAMPTTLSRLPSRTWHPVLYTQAAPARGVAVSSLYALLLSLR
jgi:hypothetical protein